MNYFKIASIVLCASAAIIVASCAKNNSPVNSSNAGSYFESVVNGSDPQTSELMTSSESALNDQATYSIAMGSQPLTPQIKSIAADTGIVPLAWGRFITGVTHAITKIDSVSDSIRVVTLQTTVTGDFVIRGILAGTSDTVTVKKPYTETFHRLLRFIRVPDNDDEDDEGFDEGFRWRLDAVSILNGGTTNAQIAITNIQVITPIDTLSVSDPDAYFIALKRGEHWRFFPIFDDQIQVTVNVTVHSNSADTDIVTLHYVPMNFGLHRKPMTFVSSTANGGGFDRVYTATLIVPANGRKFSHLLVSATTHESLFTATTTNFSSSLWGLPYKTSE